MSNFEIRELLKKKRIRQYELAAEMQISEFTLSRWLRDELSKSKKDDVLQAIQRIVERSC